MRIIDLSAEIVPSPEGTPAFISTGLTLNDHDHGAAQVEQILHVPRHLLRNGEGWATETFTRLMTHDVTHVDAPWHYNSTIQGQRAQTIDEIPLEWFFQDGVVLDFSHKAKGDAVTTENLQYELDRIGYRLHPLNIVMIRTGCDKFYGTPGYMFQGPGVTAEATRWLYEQGVRVMGIDAWGWDQPLDVQAQEALQRQEGGIFWAAHQADIPYCQIERLVHLDQLPPFGYRVACFPLKVKGGSAGPARVVAILPD